MLEQFINDNDIDLQAVERIRHRLFVVGRFNQRRKGEPYPEVWLFTNRPAHELPKKYTDHFEAVRDLRYESFVQCLQPALAEKVEYEGQDADTAIPKVLQVVPRGGDFDEGTAVLDVFNYLFQRAISSTTQTALSASRPALPNGMDSVGSTHAGKGIFWLIRRNLHTFSKFQPRTHEIVDVIGTLIAKCSREHGMPAYADGGALPGGFPERLIDFVYAEDARLPFNSEGIDFRARPWNEIDKDPEKRKMFENVVTAYRDALLGVKQEQFGSLRFKGQSLNYHAKSAVPSDLGKEFNEAREAYNVLRQVLRSKALISVVLDWVLTAYYDLKDVKELPLTAKPVERDRAVEVAVLERWKENKVARPVPRPSLEERNTFSKDLTANFEHLFTALVADQSTAAKSLEKLPQEIRDLAEKLRKDSPEQVEALREMSTSDSDPGDRQAFVQACQVILLDIICPTLYQQPILSEDMLRDFFKRETKSVYLTAVFLARDSKDMARAIAERNLEFFQSKIDKAQHITDSGEIHAKLLNEVIELISSKEIQRRMRDGLNVLKEAQTILDNMPAGLSAGSISAVRPDQLLKPSLILKDTELKVDDVNAAIKSIVDGMIRAKQADSIEKVVIKEGAAGSSSKSAAQPEPAPATPVVAGSPASAPGGPAAGTAGAAPDSAAPPEPAKKGPVEIRKSVAEKVDQVVESFFKDKKTKTIESSDVDGLVKQATTELLEDNGFMGPVRKYVRSYEEVLFLIYQRYNENPEKKNFCNRVERLTLINAMMLFREELGLGRVSSNLYHLLLDLVQDMDPENPDPAAFIRENSLTKYFDNVKLEKGGFTNLKETLNAQAHQNLQQTVDFVSELWGVKYLMDRVASDRQAEVIVVNATASEFLNWLTTDNLADPDAMSGGLRAGKLVTEQNHWQSSIQPGLVYLTDSAFDQPGDDPKAAFLDELATNIQLRSSALSMLIPPLCMSTRYLEGNNAWKTDGVRWARKAQHVPAPVVVLGPSAFLNDRNDHFRTYLPAGYLFGAHFLSQPDQGIAIENVDGATEGRFRVIGYGFVGMRESLQRVFWGEGPNDSYAFAVDYYLYIVLTLLATALRRGAAGEVNVAEFYKNFYRPRLGWQDWASSAIINKALIGTNALQFSMSVELSPDQDLPTVGFNKDGLTDQNAVRTIRDIAWFNLARRRAGLMSGSPPSASTTSEKGERS